MRTRRLTITELEQIRQRAEAASPVTWQVMTEDSDQYIIGDNHVMDFAEARQTDIDFVTTSRTDVPRLLTEVETLITEKAAARRMIDELVGEMANAAEAGYALAPETVRDDLEKIRKELIDHGE